MVYYTGDIHGNAKAIVAFAQYFELTESDTIVILGDVGANYYGNRRDRYCKDALARIKPYGLTPEEAAVQFFEYCADPKTQGHAIELLKIWKEEQELLERNGANAK